LLLPAGFQLERAIELLKEPGDLNTDDIKEFIELSSERAKRQRLTRWALATVGPIASVLLLAFISASAYWAEQEKAAVAYQQSIEARASEALSRNYFFAGQIAKLEVESKSKAAYYFEVKRDAARSSETSPETAFSVLNDWQGIQTMLASLRRDERASTDDVISESKQLWDSISPDERKRIIARVESGLRDAAGRDKQSGLRVALYAVSGIPENDKLLTQRLESAIKGFRQKFYFKPPGASQTWAVAVNPVNPNQIVVGDNNGVVWLWNPISPGAETTRSFGADQSLKFPALTTSAGIVSGLAFNSYGTMLAVAYRNNGVAVWDSSSAEPFCKLRPISGNQGAYSVAFGGKFLAIGGGDGKVHLWDAASEKCEEILTFDLEFGLVFGVAFHFERKLIAAAGNDGRVVMWSMAEPQSSPKEFIKSSSPMLAVGFSPDGTMLGAIGANKVGYLWNVDTLQPIATLEAKTDSGHIGQAAFSPMQDFVVPSAANRGDAIISSPTTGKELIRLENKGKDLFGVAFTPAPGSPQGSSSESENLYLPILSERSLSMLFAPRGVGKTLLGLSIGLAVANIALRRPDDYSPEQGARFEIHLEKLRNRVDGAGAVPFEARIESANGDIRWLSADLMPPRLKQAAVLFSDGHSARQVAALLGISSSEAGRLRLRAVDAGLLATSEEVQVPKANGSLPN
jgi:WD40 repeat protein